MNSEGKTMVKEGIGRIYETKFNKRPFKKVKETWRNQRGQSLDLLELMDGQKSEITMRVVGILTGRQKAAQIIE